MVTVPRSNRQQVAVQPLGNVRQQIAVTPETFGAGQARALEQGGQQLQRGGAQLGAAALDSARRQTETEARQAIADWRKRTTPILTDYQSQQGRNAVHGYTALPGQLDSVTAEVRGQLSGDRARELFDAAVTARRTALDATTAGHYHRQLRLYEVGALGALFESAVEQGIAAPETIPQQVREIRAAATELQALTGESDEEREGRILTAVTSMHAAVIDRLLADGNVTVAAAHFETHQGAMLPSQQARVGRRIEVVRKQSMALAQAQLRTGIQDEIASLRRTGQRAGVVSNAQIQAAYGEQAGDIIDGLNREAAFYEVRQEVATNTPAEDAALLAAIAPGAPTPTADPTEGLPDPAVVVRTKPLVQLREGGQSYERTITITDEAINGGRPTNIPTIWDGEQLSDAAAVRAAVESGQTFPTYETVESAAAAARERSEAIGRAAEVEQFRVEGEGFREEAERYDLILKAAQDKYAALAADPAAYVLSSNPAVARAYEAARQDPRQLPAAIGVSLAEQERLGVPSWETRALPEGSASAVAAEFMAIEDPTQQANRVADLARLYGPHWPRVQGELVEAGMPGTTGVLAGMSAPTQAHARMSLAEAQHEGRPVLERAVGTEVKTEVDDQVRVELADLQETLRGPGGVGIYETHREAVSLLALKYVSAGMNPAEAVRKAASDIINDQYQFVGTYRVPRGVDLARVQATVARTESLVRQGGALPLGVDELTSLDPRLEPAEAQRQYAASLLAGGYIVTNEDETGLVWVDEQGVPAAWPDGRRLEIRFDNLDLVSQGIGQDFDYMGTP